MKFNGRFHKITRVDSPPSRIIRPIRTGDERGKRGTAAHQTARKVGTRIVWVLDTDTPAC